MYSDYFGLRQPPFGQRQGNFGHPRFTGKGRSIGVQRVLRCGGCFRGGNIATLHDLGTQGMGRRVEDKLSPKNLTFDKCSTSPSGRRREIVLQQRKGRAFGVVRQPR